MFYLERKPVAQLHRFVQTLWYASTPEPSPGRQRVLPTGSTQIILELDRGYLLDCREGQPSQPAPAAQIVGARSTYELIDNSDLTAIIGLVVRPGGFSSLIDAPANLFSNRFVDLGDLWGRQARDLREQLCMIPSPAARLTCLEEFLLRKLASRPGHIALEPHPAVSFALHRFACPTSVVSVAEVARGTGWSQRRFSQLFREQVGLTPKVWCRIQRFQRAVRQLHSGPEIRWGELALDCGYYDQSHFANDFRAFSGIDISTYSAAGRTLWANHVVEL